MMSDLPTTLNRFDNPMSRNNGRAMGARVIATARGAAKAAVLKTYGAEAVIDYTQGPFKDQVKALTDGTGADVIYDPVGGDVFDQLLRCHRNDEQQYCLKDWGLQNTHF